MWQVSHLAKTVLRMSKKYRLSSQISRIQSCQLPKSKLMINYLRTLKRKKMWSSVIMVLLKIHIKVWAQLNSLCIALDINIRLQTHEKTFTRISKIMISDLIPTECRFVKKNTQTFLMICLKEATLLSFCKTNAKSISK